MKTMFVPEGLSGEITNQWGAFVVTEGKVTVPDEAVPFLRPYGYVLQGGVLDVTRNLAASVREELSSLTPRVEYLEQSGGGGTSMDPGDLILYLQNGLT